MHFNYGYGKGSREFDINDGNILCELRQNKVNVRTTGVEEVKRALKNPIGTDRLSAIVKPGEKIAIVTSDITRPMPSRLVLPPVLDELAEAGVRDEVLCIAPFSLKEYLPLLGF